MERALARSRDPKAAAQGTSRRTRLMIVDDSNIARAVLSRMISADPDFEIVANAGTAEDAVKALDHCQVDVVLLDLEMPGEGGLKSIPRILAAAGGAKVMIVSSLAEEGAEQTVAALALGAADTLPKPGTGRFNGKFSEVLLSRLKALGRSPVPMARYASKPNDSGAQLKLRSMPADPIDILTIGASTGGIHALNAFFANLPARIGVPILITQHLPGPFMPVFARQLGVAAKRRAVIAENGMRLEPDLIMIAPGDAHISLDPQGRHTAIRLSNAPASSGCRPSVDPMMAAAGTLFGRRALGVMLTGMGRDGCEGAAKMIACGGAVIAQDEESSAVWGMPRAVYDAGLASALLPPDKIARRVAGRCREMAPCK